MNLKPSKRYSSKRTKQNSKKNKNILNREKKLRKFGWSLLYFKG